MRITYDDDFARQVLVWENDCKEGMVYQSTDASSLLVIKGEDGSAFCIREGEGVPKGRCWKPGPQSKWRAVPAELKLPTSVL